MDKYTDEQIKDITEREEKALAMLKELQLTPSAVLQSKNLGDDVFATKVIPYLQDLKFKPNATAPAQAEEVKSTPEA